MVLVRFYSSLSSMRSRDSILVDGFMPGVSFLRPFPSSYLSRQGLRTDDSDPLFFQLGLRVATGELR
jgi:hypothetical protein